MTIVFNFGSTFQPQKAYSVPELLERDALSTGSAESGNSATDSGRGSHEEESPVRGHAPPGETPLLVYCNKQVLSSFRRQ